MSYAGTFESHQAEPVKHLHRPKALEVLYDPNFTRFKVVYNVTS